MNTDSDEAAVTSLRTVAQRVKRNAVGVIYDGIDRRRIDGRGRAVFSPIIDGNVL